MIMYKELSEECKRVETNMQPIKIPKRPYFCYDGPLCGHTLYLSSPSTVVFNYNSRTGRYKGTPFGKEQNYLVWEEVNERATC